MKRIFLGLVSFLIAAMLMVCSTFTVFASPVRSSGRGQAPIQHMANYSAVSLVSTTPTENSALSTSDTAITLQFSGDITYSSTKGAAGIVLIKGKKGSDSISVAKSGSTGLIITPADGFADNTTYMLMVRGLIDSKGLVIKPISINFGTTNRSDTSTSDNSTKNDHDSNNPYFNTNMGRPDTNSFNFNMIRDQQDTSHSDYGTTTDSYSSISLVSSIPTQGETISPSDDKLTLNFSGSITYGSQRRGAGIILVQGKKSLVPVTVTKSSDSSLVIVPDSILGNNLDYTLYVNGLKDSDGFVIKPFNISFKTSASSSDDTADLASTDTTDSSSDTQFTDVPKDFWGYDAISDLANRGVVNGYSDKSFKPNASVSRSEFAVMLTKALNLKATDSSQTFADITASSWDFNAVEASKNFLTGYKTSNGTMYFYGSKNAVREDMAVALVKALGLNTVSNDSKLKNAFSDYSLISADLRDYVYTAYLNGLMLGSNGKFNPQGTLTRAEASVLLEKALQNAEKVVVDGNNTGTKTVVDGSEASTSYDTDATLSSLKYDGTMVTDFASSTLSYNISLPAGTIIVPVITAAVNDTGYATMVIIQASSLPGTATVLVTAEDGSTTKTYTITFTVEAS